MERAEGQTEIGQDDWHLLAQAGGGDEAAFRELVERHESRVVGLCQQLLGNREAALDAAQEVFLKLYRQAAKLESRGQLFTWLYRVASNYCLNRIRRRKIVRFLSLTPIGEDEEGWRFEPADERASPQERIASRERWRAMRAAIERLPENQRVVLVLAKFEGLSYKEIAETLEITRGAVESRLFRAMRSLERAQEERI